MRGESLRFFLLASIGVHSTILALLPRDTQHTSAVRRTGIVQRTTEGDVDLSILRARTRFEAGASPGRTLETTSRRAVALARAPLDPPNAPPRSVAALDVGLAGSGPGVRRPIETRLTDRDDGTSMSERLPNTLTQNQVQRIDTARDRATWDDRRATPSPAPDTLVANPTRAGDAMLRAEARLPTVASEASKAGAAETAVPPAETVAYVSSAPAYDDAAATVDEDDGQASATAAPSVASDAQPRAAWQRPDVAEGSASVPAAERGRRTRDHRSGRLWTNHFYRSYVDASAVSGDGVVGSGDGHAGRGRGQQDDGSGARAHGADTAGPTWISTWGGDPRYLTYFQQIHRRIDPLWREAFPETLRLSHEQGTVVVGFALHRDGSVTGVRVLRRSGHPEFDQKVVAAVRRAAPFGPIPTEIEADVLHVSAPFQFSNPMF